MNSSILVGIGALLLGGVGGYMVGSGSGDDPADPAAAAAAREASKLVRGSGGPGREVTLGRARGGSFEDIMKEPGQTARLQSLLDYYAGLDPDQFELEAEKIDDLPFSERMIASYLLFSRWAEIDPEAALAYANTMGRGGFMVRPTILQSWASTDPRGAARYYEDNPREFMMMGGFRGRDGGGNAAGQIAAEWAKQNPQEALEWAQGLEGRDADAAVGSIFRQLAGEDPARAAQLAAGLTDEQREGAYRSIAREWGGKDFAATEAWLNTLPAGERDAAMAEAVRGLAGDDPQRAAGELGKITNEEVRLEAIRSVAANLTRADAGAAYEFATSQPEGQLRDAAVSTYVFSNRDGDVATNLQLAESIGDDGSRQRAVASTAMRWMQDDRDAALEYIETTGALAEETKERILNRVEEGGDDRGPFGRGGPGGPPGR